MKERELQKYLRKCRLLPVEPGPVVAGFRCAAVIPACDELEEIGNTLASLAPGADDMVLLVVNHPADAPSRVKAASGELLRLLASGAFSCRNLFWIDAPDLTGGVGEARKLGMDGLALDDVVKAQAQYLNPYILEERQLNVTQMDVFSRLMMDRIIFLGTEIDDYTANTLQAQLLYLDSVDSGKDISIYINSPGGSVTAGLGIYDTMQFISSDVSTICTGMAASMAAVLLVAGTEGKRAALRHSRVMIHQPLG